MNLWLRLFVGGFIIYMLLDVFKGLGGQAAKDQIILGGLSLVICLASLVIMGNSAFRLIKKDYYDPIRELTESSEDEDTAQETEESDK